MSETQHHLRESTTNTFIAWVVMILGCIAGIAFIVLFGQIETRNDNLDIVQVWSGKIIAVGIGIIMNGLLFGYLLLKVSSILQYYEQRKITNIAD
ncbi:hypothetical protein LF296_07570 [Acinetobacter vivianii]|jgi:hypothetical protein|uniref:MotA/TolQ/ExbB proton channel domain-containing protein n=1 Tax=Acinetobacter vivianii TaxID=1776742 RepID=N8UY00_9GAMM|nr:MULTISPECIES: hypothetical protein [Acinetobacter]ENU92456.1 hypothetical protein F971_02347 [Acinetobacter vivianii]ENX22232.1 hypothetical protein F892_01474 [Acinetobacter vivianii]KHF76127.1 hypothetical protein PJ15_2336 [Acinetobacter sp. neg1]MBJ8481737.1 hypothetical protein [Acinetobacter vivianii]MEB6478612.1 hypothetical protein [Acinetobacter vivianii]